VLESIPATKLPPRYSQNRGKLQLLSAFGGSQAFLVDKDREPGTTTQVPENMTERAIESSRLDCENGGTLG